MLPCAWQEGEVPSEKEGCRMICNSSVWELSLPGLCKSLHWSIQEQQVSPDVICRAKPTSQTGFPDSPRRDKYPGKRKRDFSHPFTSSLPSALLGDLPLRPNCGFDPTCAGSCVCSAPPLQRLAPIPSSRSVWKIRVIAQNGGGRHPRRSRCFTSAFGNVKFLFQE